MRRGSTRCRPTSWPTCAPGSRACAHALMRLPQLADVNSDQQDHGLQTSLVIDRDAAARLGLTMSAIDSDAERRLRPAPGRRDLQPAEPVPRGDGAGAALAAESETLNALRCCRRRAAPRCRCRRWRACETTNTPLAVNHQSGTPASDDQLQPRAGRVAVAGHRCGERGDGAASACRPSVRGSFQGTAQAFQAR